MPDRVKGAIFNLLRGHVEGERVIDLFAGIGTMGLEAFSRGAIEVVHVERDRRVAEILEHNIDTLRGQTVCRVAKLDALSPALIARCPRSVHLIFADPPYALVRDPEQYEKLRQQLARLVTLLDDTGYLVLRLPAPLSFEITPDFEHDTEAFEREMDENDRGRIIITSLDDPAWEQVDELEQEILREDRLPAGARIADDGSAHVDADLSIAGAIGPESHLYGDKGVYLYMRDPAGRGNPFHAEPGADATASAEDPPE